MQVLREAELAELKLSFQQVRHHGEPGEAADLSHLPGTVYKACRHLTLPAQPLQKMCQ